ncbi:unnamed protein product [Medioppia subpectinata]|uniref:Uncharacterized protein n=1 Tax=Medioppia subpectinata TaxID=1979941 RepID=A0A7R9KLL1_9ACAR|nr:unnamed protein product [Medioppia subpectinata]CAG2104629.1 unnamed protein product [Medioppia subpectinata]
MPLSNSANACHMKHSISLTRISSTLRRSSAKLLQKMKSTYPDYYPEFINARMKRTLSMSTITSQEVAATHENFTTNLLNMKNKTSSSVLNDNMALLWEPFGHLVLKFYGIYVLSEDIVTVMTVQRHPSLPTHPTLPTLVDNCPLKA